MKMLEKNLKNNKRSNNRHFEIILLKEIDIYIYKQNLTSFPVALIP